MSLGMNLLLVLFCCVAAANALKVPYAATASLSLTRNHVVTRQASLPLKSIAADLAIETDSSTASEDNKTLIPLKLIIAGAPAAGKGTQCENIKDAFDVVHLSTGDMLRAAVKEGSDLGIKAKEFMDNGQLVPDELITNVVCERLKQEDCMKKGWLLDGFPRTLSQAEALKDAGMNPDCFLLLNVPQEVLVERVTGRRTDPESGKIYHMTFSPPPADDESLLKRLVQRSDDTEEKIVVRYQEFLTHVGSVRGCYEDVCVEVDGSQTPADVKEVISSALSATKAAKEKEVLLKAEKNKQATSLVMGLYALYTTDRLLAAGFMKAGITFPSPLIGMVALFSGLSTLSDYKPELAEKVNKFLTPASAFLKLWLSCLLVPPVVVAPLKVAIFKANGTKFLAIVGLGFLFSLICTGFIADGGKVSFKSAITESDEILADTEQETSHAQKASPAISLPSLPPFTGPAKATLASLVVCVASTMMAFEKASGLSQRVFGTALTVTSYLFAVQQTPATLKLLLHPVMLSGAMICGGYAALATLTGQALAPVLNSYFGGGHGPGDVLSRLLGTAILSFGVQLYQYKDLLLNNKVRFLSSTLFTAVTGILTSAAGARFLGVVGSASQASILTRCITTPLAIAAGRVTMSDATCTSALSLLTGIIGASFGEKILKKLKIEDPLSQGIAVGGASHSLGASSLVDNPVKFSAAIVSMCLTGFWTVAMLGYTPFRAAVLAFAAGA